MIRILLCVSVFIVFGIALHPEASRATKASTALLTAATAPTNFQKLPAPASYFRLNFTTFLKAATRSEEITTIENILLDGRIVSLDLEQFAVLSKGASILLAARNGDRPLSTPNHVLLHGTVRGEPDSHVYIAAFENYAMGYIDIHHGDTLLHYLLQPIGAQTESGSVMILYRPDADQAMSGAQWTCGAEEFAPNMPRIQRIAEEMAIAEKKTSKVTPQGAMVHLLSIALECDTSYYYAHHTDTTESINYALAVAGAQSDIYLRDLRVGLFVGFLRIWAHDDPYPGADIGTQLGDLLNYWNGNMAYVHRAGTLLYTNRGGGGLAYVGALCTEGDGTYAYGVCGLNNNYTFPKDGYIWDVDVSSHEFGHIVGSLHTHNCSWNPPVDSCVAAEGGCYPNVKPTRGTIMSYCHLTSFGTELKFHPRVKTFLISTKLNTARCATFVEMPVAIARPNKYVCPGGSVMLGRDSISGTSPFVYSWRPPNGLSSTTDEIVRASPTKTTTYIITLEDANMLRSYDTVTVFVDQPLVYAGGDVNACGVNSIAVSAQPTGVAPFRYTWTDRSTGKVISTAKDVVLPASKSNTFVLHMIDTVGCDATDSMHVIVGSKPSAHLTVIGDTNLCEGQSTLLDAGSGFASYKWNNGATVQQIKVAKSGVYSCIVSSNGVGCADTSRTITVTVNPLPQKPSIALVGDSLVASSEPNYQWYRGASPIPGATSPDLKPTVSGLYSVRTSNNEGCAISSDGYQFTASGVQYDRALIDGVSLYPNPARESVTIMSSGILMRSVVITDLLGKELIAARDLRGESQQLVKLEVKQLLEGVYFAQYTLITGAIGSIRFVR